MRVSSTLGLGLISDKNNRKHTKRVVAISIERLGIIRDIIIENKTITYPKGVKLTTGLKARIELYLGL